tara:strand:- start:217 stop:438 length:222 start_codon:yes stop_codon:yes gene_type:complete
MDNNPNKNEIVDDKKETETEIKKPKKKYVYPHYKIKTLCICGGYHTIYNTFCHNKTILHKLYLHVNKQIKILN